MSWRQTLIPLSPLKEKGVIKLNLTTPLLFFSTLHFQFFVPQRFLPYKGD